MRFCLVPVFLFVLLLSGCGDRRTGGDVILIIVDTLRSDHLGCYGYHRDTTPSMDSLARAGVRYTSVTAGEPWTLPSMATISPDCFHWNTTPAEGERTTTDLPRRR